MARSLIHPLDPGPVIPEYGFSHPAAPLLPIALGFVHSLTPIHRALSFSTPCPLVWLFFLPCPLSVLLFPSLLSAWPFLQAVHAVRFLLLLLLGLRVVFLGVLLLGLALLAHAPLGRQPSQLLHRFLQLRD